MCYVTSWYFSQGNLRRVCLEREVISKICLHFIYKRRRDFMFLLVKKQVKRIYSNSTSKFHNPWKQNQKQQEIPVTIELLFYCYHLQQNRAFVFKNFYCSCSFIGAFPFSPLPLFISSSFSASSFRIGNVITECEDYSVNLLEREHRGMSFPSWRSLCL